MQAGITCGQALLFAALYRRYRKPAFFWWTVAWVLYLLRLVAIIIFLRTEDPFWLFWHQVATGWTALALLWSALVFSRGLTLDRRFLLLLLFPVAWGVLAIYQLEDFHRAAWPAVLFLSLATLWTAHVFFRFQRLTHSRGARLLAAAFLLWGLHHLDYPLLRAQGGWNPWGYYLDIAFTLAVGAGMLLLVQEDLERGLSALAALTGLGNGEPGGQGDLTATLLTRLLSLPGVRGAAMREERSGRLIRCVGLCQEWTTHAPDPAAYAFTATLPVKAEGVEPREIILVGDARDPFTALDERFLTALGDQIGAGLERADLTRRLERRTIELERLSARMVAQHEEERRRLSRELHDETAQVLSAMKMQLGLLREAAPTEEVPKVDRVMALVDEGMRSIRNVTEALRPSLLDLGLLPALRALAAEFRDRAGLQVELATPETLPELPEEAELGVFRAVQEGLANVARHAEARTVQIALRMTEGALHVTIQDDGRGLGTGPEERLGLTGMRERLSSLGGRVTLTGATTGGTILSLSLPVAADG